MFLLYFFLPTNQWESFHFVTETCSCLSFNSLSGQSPSIIHLTTIVKLGLSMASQCPQVTPNDHKILSAPANVYLGHTSPSLLLKPHTVPVNKHRISYLFLSSSENLNRYLSHCGIALNYYLWLTVTSQTHVVPLYVSTTLKLT